MTTEGYCLSLCAQHSTGATAAWGGTWMGEGDWLSPGRGLKKMYRGVEAAVSRRGSTHAYNRCPGPGAGEWGNQEQKWRQTRVGFASPGLVILLGVQGGSRGSQTTKARREENEEKTISCPCLPPFGRNFDFGG